ncbi:hypothetical protein LCGC14_2757880 [marine sediment metagenome]|uniref:HK97 gp10 family phage protein n=1 Tax=marine sediment metagenome TaxID=412755 RepID=A0A0F9B8G0_9ZZZZ
MSGEVVFEFEPRSLAKLHRKLTRSGLIDIPAEKFYDVVATTIGKRGRDKAPEDLGDVKRGIKVLKPDRETRLVVATAPHSIYAHEGTKPHWPPVDAVRGWAERHGIEPFLVARAISKKGTKAVPFLKDAAEETFQRLQPSLLSFSRGVEKQWDR